ncbi:polysaccharide pyruvyl transferase CsaB [Vallitalea longa]|uniref:Polysaccharide pyruvyl transferase CsaB n=1 Tax=Vallitalea longa TaxID=2936439 RepID=A0A9W6DFC8_9FIRM|nr:polysaccharide pyruvyl transferase CsaB [Vallitalea longa]GKX30450.1 polysaccharide pyruvyl transferase CsaB [Vallitalea longa]
MINIVISGYIGYSNCGDDAILLAICEGIRELNIEANITALSKNPTITMRDNNIKSVYRFNWREVARTIKNADIIISGGGSLLQDTTSTRSLLYYLGIIRLAKFHNKKVMLYANGIGPIYKKINRLMTKYIVNKVDLITLRDDLSKRDLDSMKVTKPKIHVTADPVFSMNINKKRYKDLLKDNNIPLDKPLVGILFREWKNINYEEIIANVCDELIANKDVNIVFIPMEYKEDIDISKRIASRMKQNSYVLDEDLDSSSIIGVIGEMHMILSMRLHALLFAALSSVPMVGFVYDPKVSCYLDLLKMPSAGNVKELNKTYINDIVNDVYNNYDKYVNQLDEIKVEMRKKSELNNKYLLDLINSNID